MTFDELAVFARRSWSATWGIAQDGGGSSTMVINGQVINSPSDPCHRSNGSRVNSSPASKSLQLGTVETVIDITPQAESGVCERQVANGMMMVVGEPKDQSRVFVPGMAISTATITDVRLGPGTNFGVISTFRQTRVELSFITKQDWMGFWQSTAIGGTRLSEMSRVGFARRILSSPG